MKNCIRLSFLTLSLGAINIAWANIPPPPSFSPPPPAQVQKPTNSTQNTSTDSNAMRYQYNSAPAFQQSDSIGVSNPIKSRNGTEQSKEEMDKLSKVTLSKPYIDDNLITIGTGAITNVYYPAGGAICRMMNRAKKQTGITCSVESSAGSIYNLQALRNAEMDFALVQSDWQEIAYDGTDSFQKAGPFEKLRFVFSLHNEALTVIVRKESDINKLDDLQNKVINIGHPGTGVRATVERLMKIKGWNNQTFSSVTDYKTEEQIDALCDKKIDAMIVLAGHPSSIVQDAMSMCETKIINTDDPVILDYLSKNEEFATTTIPGGLYVGAPDTIKTFGIKATLLTTTDSSEDVVYQLTKAVFENLSNFKKLHPVFYNLSAEAMINEGRSIPMHPGAMKYFEEKGYIK